MNGSSPSSVAPSEFREGAARRPWLNTDAIDRWLERSILGLVLFLLVFSPIAFGAMELPQVLVIPAVTCAILLLWFGRIWLTRSYRLLWAPICWAVVLFVGYGIARYRMLLAEHGIEYLARQELVLLLAYGALFFAILNNLSRQESTQTISLVLLALGTLLSFYACYQFVTKSKFVLWSPQYPIYYGRASGTYVCPNHFAGLLEMILPLGLAFTLCGRFKATAKVFLGYAVFAIAAGIGVSISRGAWLATGAGLLVFFGMLMRQRGQRLAAILFCVILLGGFVFFVKNLAVLQRRAGTVHAAEAKIDATRSELWTPSYRMWRDHFWWGVGPAQFDYRFRGYRPDDIQMRPLYAHNDYLNTLVDYGTVGLGLIIGTIGLLYLGVFQSWKFVQRSNDLTTKRSNRSAFVLGAAAGLVAILAHSVVDFNMHVPANALVAVTLMALITGHLRFATERYWFKAGWLGKLAATAVILGGVAYLAQETARRATEYAWLRRADRATRPDQFEAKVTALKAASAIEPNNAETTFELGETFRLASWKGEPGYQTLAQEAVPWFERGSELNPYDPYEQLRWGMCLDWLDQAGEAGPHFDKALQLDPKNYYIQGLMGWHYFQLGEWERAEQWFRQSIYQAHWHPDYRLTGFQGWNYYLAKIAEKRAAKPAFP